MRIRAGLGALLAMIAGGQAMAAQLTVDVADRQGKPVADAVVTLLRRDGAGPKPGASTTHSIDQKQLMFRPYVEVARPGDSVVFRNSDTTRHHVYSFSPVKQFEYVIAPNASAPAVKLPRTGVVAIGCNIHDGMIAYLYVTDAPWTARTDATGHVVFDGLPAGAYDVRVWHPRLPPAKPDLVQANVALAADDRRRAPFTVTLLPDLRFQFDRERTRY
ncbi:carboxypeptidase regulatory-like domain-containing protein [Cognatilysobacter terrigena]|uniref:carboxypeptidase regulatory-like domain-containing protein n=1 Tax=Cognatilysobacter terrigena TaxID=2488749 RepID=UPI00105F069C|nr:carboxypeptidase regulatory-like domain-containing protein [Lysobacter terrigena]